MNLFNISSDPITPSEVRKRVEILSPEVIIELNKRIISRFNEKAATSIVNAVMITNIFQTRILHQSVVEKIAKLYESDWEVEYVNSCLRFKARW